MSIERRDDATPVATLHEQPQAAFRRRQDPLDEPPRPLPDTSAALHERRRRKTATAGPLASRSCAVEFNVRSTSTGLLVERTQRRPIGACLVQTLLFEDMDRFQRWCDVEPTRFDDPLLFDRMRRQAHEVLGGKR